MKAAAKHRTFSTLFSAYFRCIMVIGLLTILIPGCGGGGGGGSSSNSDVISYTGIEEMVTLDEDNVDDMATGAYGGGELGESLSGVGVVQSDTNVRNNKSHLFALSKTLSETVGMLDFSSSSEGVSAGAIVEDNTTIYGDCGGSADLDLRIDDVTGEFSATFNYYSYCDTGYSYNGSVILSGLYDLNNETIESFDFTFNSFSMSYSGDSFTIKGSMSVENPDTPEIIMNLYLKNNTSNKTFWIKDYIINITEIVENNYVKFNQSGQYYDPDYGYVDITTTTDFLIYDGDDNPSEGVLVLTGNTSIAGGSTMARFTALSSTTYQIEADTTGDGIYDWDSGVVGWNDVPADQ